MYLCTQGPTRKAAGWCAWRRNARENRMHPQMQVLTQLWPYREYCSRTALIIKKHYSVAGMTTPRLDALPKPSTRHAPDISLRMDPWSIAFHSPIRASVSRLGSVQFAMGSDSVKIVIEACPIDVLLDSTHRCFIGFKSGDRDAWPAHSFKSFLIQVCYDESGCVCSGTILHQDGIWPTQHLGKVSRLAGGLHLHTSHLLEYSCQWLANPYGHPEKWCPKPLWTHPGIGDIP